MIKWSDGTVFNPPKNPLEEKWARLYPPIPKPEYSEVCDGYSCDGCGRCPEGTEWKVPEEDKEVWEKYRTEFNNYINAHGGCENLVIDLNLDLIKEDKGKI